MSAYFSVLNNGEIRTRCAPCHTVEHVRSEGELSAVVAQRLPFSVQRLGYSGLFQRPDDHSADLLSAVYGLRGSLPEPEQSEPVPCSEPLPADCHAINYVSEFSEIAVRLACRNIWKVQRQSAHVDADDIAQDAVALLLDQPERYALDPIEAGASAAVNDAIRNEQGSELKRSVKFEPLAIDCGLSAPVETIPSDYETEADALSRLVGNSLAIHAALMASGVEIETHSDACGISVRTVARRRSEIRNSLVAIALSELAGNLR